MLYIAREYYRRPFEEADNYYLWNREPQPNKDNEWREKEGWCKKYFDSSHSNILIPNRLNYLFQCKPEPLKCTLERCTGGADFYIQKYDDQVFVDYGSSAS